MEINAVKYHQQAEKLREEDKLYQALKNCNQAILLYKKEKDYLNYCLAIQSRILTYKHLYLKKQDKSYSLLAKKDALLVIRVCQKRKLNILYSSYFRLGEIFMLFNDYKKAIIYFKKALYLYPQINSEKGDYQYHLGEAMYISGNKINGLKNILNGLEIIQEYRNKTDSFLIHVWESGCYLKLAQLLRLDNHLNAKIYLNKAAKIINNDKKLIIRKRQYNETRRLFKSNQ